MAGVAALVLSRALTWLCAGGWSSKAPTRALAIHHERLEAARLPAPPPPLGGGLLTPSTALIQPAAMSATTTNAAQ
eukprot:1122499-Prorocentrum_minimum.AAC.1